MKKKLILSLLCSSSLCFSAERFHTDAETTICLLESINENLTHLIFEVSKITVNQTLIIDQLSRVNVYLYDEEGASWDNEGKKD